MLLTARRRRAGGCRQSRSAFSSYCYLDGELATDAYIDWTCKDRGNKEDLPISKACENNGGAQLVWSRDTKTNKLQDANAKSKRKGAKRSNVRSKRTKHAGGA